MENNESPEEFVEDLSMFTFPSNKTEEELDASFIEVINRIAALMSRKKRPRYFKNGKELTDKAEIEKLKKIMNYALKNGK